VALDVRGEPAQLGIRGQKGGIERLLGRVGHDGSLWGRAQRDADPPASGGTNECTGEMAIMARLQVRSGTVRRVNRITTPWRGAHGDRITTLDLAGTAVRFEGLPSVGVGDVVTVVGYLSRNGMHAKALRNESTDVSYAASVWPAGLMATLVLAVAMPIVSFPAAIALVPVGAAALGVAVRNYHVRWLLDAQPSHHRAPVRVPHHAMGHESRR
jgi:hypothetical protein